MTTGIKYQFQIDESDPNNSHSLILKLIAETGMTGMDVLEVGCSSGYVGAALVGKGHRVTGVEVDPVAAEAARTALSEVHAGDAESFFALHPDRRFDAILLGDVLEHMTDPLATLRRCREHLTSAGAIAISLPCVTHGSVRAMLLDGQWEYGDYGLLDRTHLRFFSHRGVAELLSGAGLQIVRLHAVTMPIETAGHEYDMALRAEAIAAVELLSTNAELLDFQYVLLARPSSPATTADARLAHNLAVPVQRPPLPRRPGDRSGIQQLRIRMFQALFRRIVQRRFRNGGA